MRKSFFEKYTAIVLIIIIVIATGCRAQRINQKAGWISLFNGSNLDGWVVKIKDHPLNQNYGNTFRVENGIMKVSYEQYDSFKSQFGHIFYKQPFSAYLLVIEYRFVGQQIKDGPGWALRNSGAMLHGQSPESMKVEQDFPISLEGQFLGGNGKDARSTANLCTPGTHVVMREKLITEHCIVSNSKTYHGDQWVRAEMLVLGDSLIRHIVEGDTVLEYSKPQYDGNDKWVKQAGLPNGGPIKSGYISLQAESHPIEFRKVDLFDLSPFMNDQKKLEKKLREL